jgi:hydrogenase maturation protease
MKNNVTLIGLGNVLLRDDGIGIHALNIIRKRFSFSPPIEIIDGGTMGLDLLPFLKDGSKLLFLDAVDFDREPGYIKTLEDEEIPSTLQTKLSVHHIGLSDLLWAARLMDIRPGRICLMGIQPESIDVGLEMTERIGSRVDELVQRIIHKLEEWNITCALQSPYGSSK